MPQDQSMEEQKQERSPENAFFSLPHYHVFKREVTDASF